MAWLIKKDDSKPITVRVIDSDAAPVAGLSLTSSWKWTKSGGAIGNAAGTLTDRTLGVYEYTPTAGEVDTLGNAALTFHDTTNSYVSVGGGVQVVAFDPRDAVRLGLTALASASAVYYVSKSGNDSNDGLSPGAAKLTIGSALSAASAGDTIRIARGTYTEKLDLSAKSNITLEGDGKSVIITQSSGGDAQNDYVVKVGNGTKLRNLTLTQAYAGSQLATGATAVYGSSVARVTIDDVYISSTDSGILIYDGRNTTIRNSTIDSSEIGINLATGESSGIIDGCNVRCTNWTYCSSYAITVGGSGMGNNSYVIRNTRAYVNRANYTGGQPYAIEAFGAHVVATNCVFAAEMGVAEGALPAQKVIAVLVNNSAGAGYEFTSCVILDGCVLSSIDGDLNVGTHIVNTDSYSTVYATGTTVYDRSKVVGTVTDSIRTIQAQTDKLTFDGSNRVAADAKLLPNPAPSGYGGGGSSGTGAYAITVNVKEGVTNMSGATVSLTQGSDVYTATTNASGNASFSLDAGTFTLAIWKAGYSFTPESVTVTAAATLNKTITSTALPPATDPARKTIQITTKDGNGATQTAKSFYWRLTSPPTDDGFAYDYSTHTATTNGSGVFTDEWLIGGKYEYWRDDNKKVRRNVTIAADTDELPEV
jgi:hypothetical protein